MKFKKEHSEQTIFDLLGLGNSETEEKEDISLRDKIRDKIRGLLPTITKAADRLLSVAQEELIGNYEDKDQKCPLCAAPVHLGKVPLSSTMADGLVWLAQECKSDMAEGLSGWVGVPDRGPKWMTKSRTHSKLRWWGLVEKKKLTRAEQKELGKKDAGLWRPTQKGFDFVAGKISVPSHAHTFKAEQMRLHGDPVYLHDVSSVPGFNYNDFLGA